MLPHKLYTSSLTNRCTCAVSQVVKCASAQFSTSLVAFVYGKTSSRIQIPARRFFWSDSKQECQLFDDCLITAEIGEIKQSQWMVQVDKSQHKSCSICYIRCPVLGWIVDESVRPILWVTVGVFQNVSRPASRNWRCKYFHTDRQPWLSWFMEQKVLLVPVGRSWIVKTSALVIVASL